MIVTAQQALAVAQLNLQLAIEERNIARDSDSERRLNGFIAVLSRQVGFWEDRVANDKAAAAEA